MSKVSSGLIKKLEMNIQEREAFKEAFMPSLNAVGKHISDGHVIINMDLARVLLDYVAGSQLHDKELAVLLDNEKNRNIPALERASPSA